MDRTSPPSQKTTPPVIPFLPLNLYGAKEASEKECRMQCRAAPIISSSYFGDGSRRQVPTSPCKKRSKALIAISVPCVGAACCEPIRLRNNFRSCRDCAIHSSFPSALRNLEYAAAVRGCCMLLSVKALSSTAATSGTVLDPLFTLNSTKVVSRNFGSTPIDNESSVAPR